MKPVRSIKNQYRGINPHLHSYWQSEGGWNSFHSSHIIHLMTLMKAQLRPMGYTADVVQSLQIRRYEDPVGRPESDVTIYDLDPARSVTALTRQMSAHQLVLPIPQILGLNEPTEKQYDAIGIYRYEQPNRGTPVAWIELLSPSNKPGGQDAERYHDKRLKLLQSGIVFVEVDYLHESLPTLENVPIYRTRGQSQPSQMGSHPYRIAVIDPRPVFIEGKGHITEFDVDEDIPTIEIPLNDRDIFSFDFGAAYTKTFEETFYGDDVDYTQFPQNLDRYSPADQTRIAVRMLAVLEATHDGVDLETGPFPARGLSLEEAMAELQTLIG